jgi:hypothetical protein
MEEKRTREKEGGRRKEVGGGGRREEEEGRRGGTHMGWNMSLNCVAMIEKAEGAQVLADSQLVALTYKGSHPLILPRTEDLTARWFSSSS